MSKMNEKKLNLIDDIYANATLNIDKNIEQEIAWLKENVNAVLFEYDEDKHILNFKLDKNPFWFMKNVNKMIEKYKDNNFECNYNQ